MRATLTSIATILLGVVAICFPWGMHYVVSHFGVTPLACLLAGLSLCQSIRSPSPWKITTSVATSVLALVSISTQNEKVLTYYPVLVTLCALFFFAQSLQTVPMIERFARLRHPNLPPEGQIWCRRVTQVWCGFFVINAIIALWTTTQSQAIWTLYNGCISYILMGILFVGEYLLRIRAQKRATQSH